MRYRRSDYDVTNTVQVSSAAAVRRAVEELFAQTWPGEPVDRIAAAFAWNAGDRASIALTMILMG